MFSQLPGWFLYIIAGLLGAILGSFANVCIVRLPRSKSVVWPPSHCPLCDHRLTWWENLPLVSFLILKGRCRRCRGRISVRYPIVELLCIALSVLLWRYFSNPLEYLVYLCLFIVPLVVVSFIDLSHRIVPDVISIPGIFVGIGAHTLLAGKGRYGEAAIDSLAGAVAGALFLFLVAYAYEKLKKQEGLGGGDIKLMAMLGAFFGWRAAIFILLMSSVIGSVIGIIFIIILRKDMKFAVPFGPFLALAGIINLFVGDRLVYWYMDLFF